MTFPNSCSFLRLSEGRLRLHLSTLLCRLYNMQSSGEEFYTEICGAWGKDSDSGGNTCLCVCVSLWPGAQVTVLPLQQLYALSAQHLSSLVQTALMALDCRSSWAEQLLWSNFVAWLCVSCGSPQLYENCSLWFSSLQSSSAAKKVSWLRSSSSYFRPGQAKVCLFCYLEFCPSV